MNDGFAEPLSYYLLQFSVEVCSIITYHGTCDEIVGDIFHIPNCFSRVLACALELHSRNPSGNMTHCNARILADRIISWYEIFVILTDREEVAQCRAGTTTNEALSDTVLHGPHELVVFMRGDSASVSDFENDCYYVAVIASERE